VGREGLETPLLKFAKFQVGLEGERGKKAEKFCCLPIKSDPKKGAEGEVQFSLFLLSPDKKKG